MGNLQDFVYALEVGSLRQWLVRLGVVTLLGGVGVFYFVKHFNGLNHQESMDSAQLSRQIARGEGYTTKFLRPVQLRLMREQVGTLEQAVPDVMTPPVYPVIGAALFKLAGANFVVDSERLRDFTVFSPERLMVLFNLGCTMLATVVLYLWMIRAFDSRVATTAVILFAVSDMIWSSAVWGLSTSFILLLICLLGFLVNESLISEENDGHGLAMFWFFLASCLVGVLILTHYGLIVCWPALIGLGALAYFRRWPMILLALFIPLLMISPWLYRNYELTGNPFGFSWFSVFADNGRYPGNLLWRTYDLNGIPANLKLLGRALALGLGNVFSNPGAFTGGFIPLTLAVAGCLHMFRRHRCQASRWFWLAVFLGVMAGTALLVKERPVSGLPASNLILFLLPVLCGFGAAFAFVLLDRLRLPTQFLVYPLVGILCLIQAFPLGLSVIKAGAPPFAYPPYFPPVIFLIKNWIEPEEVMCSDIPWAVAWYADRQCIWLPSEREEFFLLSDFEIRVAAILLTPESQQNDLYMDIDNGVYKDWADVITRREFRNLPLPSVTVLPPNKDDYFIMADRPRWQ